MSQADADRDWQADLARCGDARAWRREQSLWALWVYRFGRRVDAMPPGMGRRWRTKAYWLMFRVVETVTGISLPKDCRIGPGLRIWHFGGIFVNPGTVIGAQCTLRQGVTLGNRVPDGPCPVLEDGVELGAYAQVIGGVRLGAGCRIGAMAVVLQDVPPGATAVGNPARILPLPTTSAPAASTGTDAVPPAAAVSPMSRTPGADEPIKTSPTSIGG
ncbi:serine acetyltransferase [Roseateles depolymerans]|uniref:Serine acetyltransferase n=1 Tax=Roseateles depolymerans TaxID=76731 RepID=A0A0U3CI49_9BURK|nr:serine acetyltransferase [Roseateles depolymerans]ALV08328.1 Serine acetyltransferase [Roseateles depolymerans]REG21448.1 serine O-acetyltransferase [Roseateles depolymerans]